MSIASNPGEERGMVQHPQPLSDEEFVEWFADGWRSPTSLESFCAHFLPRMHPEVVLIQPLARTGIGQDAFRWIFGRLFATIPDLRAVVIRWCSSSKDVFIELELTGTLGGRAITWRTTDRLIIAAGLVTERRSYFDPTPIVLTILARPWAWPRILLATLRAARSSRPR